MHLSHLLRTKLHVLAIILSVTVSVVAFIAWGQMNNWQLAGISTYRLFPLFGLLAFSLLWSLYIVATVQGYLKTKSQALEDYFVVAGYVVILVILLHPGLLVYQLWRDGFGFPPGSYMRHYVAPGLGWAATLGGAAFVAFLAYEFRRLVKSERLRRWLVYPSDVAMFAVLIHSLTLGGVLQTGWFRYVWWFYGAAFAVSLLYLRLWPIIRPRFRA